ncbi:hypothetical protein FYK55_05360 [Roseiconus nitratireducens]|uniref:HEPN domain-containing protein n=1 Tax=Roseiconus nitratireducens TaxID=2605748 RepID=A0A5M6DFQ4_9BACT|nr:hypothetical protein [Roseiconus nitratireducens]KAA5545112.1 hypothetical protein FYK55_05360 [Roseiconus nitratireducens]
MATIAFYKAIQLVEALLAKRHGSVSTSHFRRLERLRVHHKDIYKQFRPLYNASMVARYLCLPDEPGSTSVAYFSSFSDYIGDAKAAIINGRLIQLEALVEKGLGEPFTKTRV